MLTLRATVEATSNTADKTAELIFSSGAGVMRRDVFGTLFREFLSLNPKHVRLERLNSGAPLLDNHQQTSVRNVIGVVVEGSARVAAGREGRATVRFSNRPEVASIYQDVKDRIVRNVSVGYVVHEYQETRLGENVIRTAVDWEPYELSLVTMPADVGARVRKEHYTEAERVDLLLKFLQLSAP